MIDPEIKFWEILCNHKREEFFAATEAAARQKLREWDRMLGDARMQFELKEITAEECAALLPPSSGARRDNDQ